MSPLHCDIVSGFMIAQLSCIKKKGPARPPGPSIFDCDMTPPFWAAAATFLLKQRQYNSGGRIGDGKRLQPQLLLYLDLVQARTFPR